MTNKEKYIKLCEKESSISIFSQYWWLDIVSNNWDVVLVEKGGEVVASFPYTIRDIFIFKVSLLPQHTPKLGIWIKYPKNQKYTTKLSYEKEIFTNLIEELPEVDYFAQAFDPSITNWLAFYWKGYKQTTRYTYIIDDLSDMEKIKSNFRSNIKTDIKKAQKRDIYIEKNDNIEEFYQVASKTFSRQDLKMKYSLESLEKLYKECKKREQGQIFLARDKEGNIHAGAFLVWDSNSAYYLKGGGDPEYRNSGATSLLMWEMIQFASTVTKKFDFEGSMIEPIERFFRAFGAKQTPYFSIYKTKNRFIDLIYNILYGG